MAHDADGQIADPRGGINALRAWFLDLMDRRTDNPLVKERPLSLIDFIAENLPDQDDPKRWSKYLRDANSAGKITLPKPAITGRIGQAHRYAPVDLRKAWPAFVNALKSLPDIPLR